MSENSNLLVPEDDQTAEAWAKLEPLVQAAITRRLHQFYDALVSREQIPAATSHTGHCVVAEATEQAGSAGRAGCSAPGDNGGSGLPPSPGARLR